MSALPQKLHLEDCLDDTPHTKAMLELFEKDTNMLKKFTKAFSGSCQKIANAQVMMISATQELSYYLRLYGKQNFPLETPSSSHLDDDPVSLLKPQKQENETSTATHGSENLDAQASQPASENKTADEKESSLASTLNQFANYIDEVSLIDIDELF